MRAVANNTGILENRSGSLILALVLSAVMQVVLLIYSPVPVIKSEGSTRYVILHNRYYKVFGFYKKLVAFNIISMKFCTTADQ